MSDFTLSQGVGATVTKVGDKIQTLKAVLLAKSTRENWASAIIYILNWLATASSFSIDAVWESLSSILSDPCSQKNLSVKIKKMIEPSKQSGELFCSLHFLVALLQYQRVLNQSSLISVSYCSSKAFFHKINCWIWYEPRKYFNFSANIRLLDEVNIYKMTGRNMEVVQKFHPSLRQNRDKKCWPYVRS